MRKRRKNTLLCPNQPCLKRDGLSWAIAYPPKCIVYFSLLGPTRSLALAIATLLLRTYLIFSFLFLVFLSPSTSLSFFLVGCCYSCSFWVRPDLAKIIGRGWRLLMMWRWHPHNFNTAIAFHASNPAKMNGALGWWRTKCNHSNSSSFLQCQNRFAEITKTGLNITILYEYNKKTIMIMMTHQAEICNFFLFFVVVVLFNPNPN